MYDDSEDKLEPPKLIQRTMRTPDVASDGSLRWRYTTWWAEEVPIYDIST